jgi:Leucine-rich repeat (LRR) protein
MGFLVLEIRGFPMARESGHEELEQRGKRSENAQKGDKEVHVGQAGSDSGSATKLKSGDRLAILVFSVAAVILVVCSFSLIKNLKSLGLNGSQGVSDLTPIAELTNLTRLSLANLKELRDLSPLTRLKGLKHLDLVNSTKITKQQINSIRRALPNCRIIDPYHYYRRRTG